MFVKKPKLDEVMLRELVVGAEAMHHLQFCDYYVSTGKANKLRVTIGMRGKRQAPEMDYILVTHIEEALRRQGYNPYNVAELYSSPRYLTVDNLSELFTQGLPLGVGIDKHGVSFKLSDWFRTKVRLFKGDVKQNPHVLVCQNPKTKKLVHLPFETKSKVDYAFTVKMFERCFELGLRPYAISTFTDTMEEQIGYAIDTVPNLYNRYIKPYYA